MNGPTVTSYPPVGAWFYPWPAQRGEARLHRVRGYHVDEQARALLVDADCGVSFTAGVAVLVPDPGADDLLCGRCRWAGQDPRPARPGHRRPHCPDHTHELTPAGRRRSIYARGVKLCRVDHPQYLLVPAPRESPGADRHAGGSR